MELSATAKTQRSPASPDRQWGLTWPSAFTATYPLAPMLIAVVMAAAMARVMDSPLGLTAYGEQLYFLPGVVLTAAATALLTWLCRDRLPRHAWGVVWAWTVVLLAVVGLWSFVAPAGPFVNAVTTYRAAFLLQVSSGVVGFWLVVRLMPPSTDQM